MQRKIINDPVYGFITIDNELIFEIINHPWFQRLRRIHQMALAQLVYPGAVHTRFHHALGAYHLMCNALNELKQKNIEISYEEEIATKIAILLHDIGHGPFSHALEGLIITNVHHEDLSLAIMEKMNLEFNGKIQLAIDIFKNKYPKKFLHQLISGQLDVDRMDYLTRDSFYTGVSEGTIAYDRILKMITVYNDELVVEEKAIFSIEKFLISRRLMYWQVYLHKTVIVAEQMLRKIIERAKEINAITNSIYLNNLIAIKKVENIKNVLNDFGNIDDVDLLASIKNWVSHSDIILSTLCKNIINRKLLKIQFVNENEIEEKLNLYKSKTDLKIDENLLKYFVFSGTVKNVMYKTEDEKINILFKSGLIKDISEVDNALVQKNVTPNNNGSEQKYYICYPINN